MCGPLSEFADKTGDVFYLFSGYFWADGYRKHFGRCTLGFREITRPCAEVRVRVLEVQSERIVDRRIDFILTQVGFQRVPPRVTNSELVIDMVAARIDVGKADVRAS